jgi:hypothetical protein
VTFKGTKKAAQAELTRLLAEVDAGTSVDPSRVTVAEYLREWLGAGERLAPKTLERYRQLADRQIRAVSEQVDSKRKNFGLARDR